MLSPKDLKDLFAESSPERIMARAQRLAAKGKVEQAIETLAAAIGRVGESAPLRLEQAQLQISSGRPREAAEALRALLRASPAEVSRVEEFIGWARAHHADVEMLYEPLAEGHVARRNLSAAVECLERIDRKTLGSLLESRLANLNRFLEKGGGVPRSATPTLYFAAAGSEALDDWQGALDSYRKILAACPADFPTIDARLKALVGRHYKLTPLRLQYAGILEESGHPDRALAEHLIALQADPNCANDVEVQIALRLEAKPDDPDLLWARAGARLASGDTPGALEVCSRLLSLGARLDDVEGLLEGLAGGGRESVESRILLARVSIARRKGARAIALAASAIEEAGPAGLDLLRELIETFPEEPRPYQILAEQHLKAGDVERCLETYRALRRVDTSTSPAISARLQSLLMADPGNTSAAAMLEEVAIEAGDARLGVPFLRRRIRIGPEEAVAALGRIQAMLTSSPSDEGLRRAAVEGCLAGGDAPAAWEHLRALIPAGRAIEASHLRLLVLCAGSSIEIYRKAKSLLSGGPASGPSRPETIFAFAEAAGRAGLYREAIEGFRAAGEAAPAGIEICREAVRSLGRDVRIERGEDRAAIAEALLEAGDVPTAAAALEDINEIPRDLAARLTDRLAGALRQDPSHVALRTALTRVCLASGNATRALEIARSGIAGRDDAESAPLVLVYGDALARAGRTGQAARAYATAAQRDPALGTAVIERLKTVIRLDIGLESAHLALGRLLIREGHVREGVNELMTAWSIKPELGPSVMKDLDRTTRRHPTEIALDFARSQLLLASGDPAGAAECLGTQIGTDPELTDEILARLEGMAARHPECAQVQFQLGRACLEKGWAARACECLTRAYELDNSLFESVAVELSRAQEKFGSEPGVHVARGALYEREGRAVPAAESYFREIEIHGDGADGAVAGLDRLCGMGAGERVPVPASALRVHLLRARACRVLGRIEEAVASAEAALDAGGELMVEAHAEVDRLVAENPGSASAMIGRARSHLRCLRIEAAVEDLAQALSIDRGGAAQVADVSREILARRPGLAAASRIRSEALRTVGDAAGAARTLDAALSSAGNGVDLDLILARRSLALEAGEAERAADLLKRAEAASGASSEILSALHREALARSDPASLSGLEPELYDAIAQGDFGLAARITEDRPPSILKAWLLERGGRPARAAACLRDLIRDPAAARQHAALHDRVVAGELTGGAQALMGATELQFNEPSGCSEKPARPARRARAEAQGGER